MKIIKEMIKSLGGLSLNEIFKAFNRAFEDYEMQLNREELEKMLKRRGFVPELSFGAFVNDELIAFTFNGIGTFNGKNTAYDTGTGTIKEYRGQGLATKIFTHSIPYLKDAGISQYLLEVLQHNKPAVSIYSKLGFEVTREFNYFIQNTGNISIDPGSRENKYRIEPLHLSQAKRLENFMDFNPSWQNSFESIERSPEDFIIYGSFRGDLIVGYCIFEPLSGDITQIAVSKEHRRKGIANDLLEEALKSNQLDSVKAINAEAAASSFTHFMNSKEISLKGKQFEMIKTL